MRRGAVFGVERDHQRQFPVDHPQMICRCRHVDRDQPRPQRQLGHVVEIEVDECPDVTIRFLGIVAIERVVPLEEPRAAGASRSFRCPGTTSQARVPERR